MDFGLDRIKAGVQRGLAKFGKEGMGRRVNAGNRLDTKCKCGHQVLGHDVDNKEGVPGKCFNSGCKCTKFSELRNGFTPNEPEPYGRGMGGAETGAQSEEVENAGAKACLHCGCDWNGHKDCDVQPLGTSGCKCGTCYEGWGPVDKKDAPSPKTKSLGWKTYMENEAPKILNVECKDCGNKFTHRDWTGRLACPKCSSENTWEVKNAGDKFTKADAIFAIEDVDSEGSYSHNIVGSILRRLAASEGNEVANQVIRELHLDRIYRIQEIKNASEDSGIPLEWDKWSQGQRIQFCKKKGMPQEDAEGLAYYSRSEVLSLIGKDAKNNSELGYQSAQKTTTAERNEPVENEDLDFRCTGCTFKTDSQLEANKHESPPEHEMMPLLANMSSAEAVNVLKNLKNTKPGFDVNKLSAREYSSYVNAMTTLGRVPRHQSVKNTATMCTCGHSSSDHAIGVWHKKQKCTKCTCQMFNESSKDTGGNDAGDNSMKNAVPLSGKILRRKPSNIDEWEVVLAKVSGAAPYVTWNFHSKSGEYQSGHYFMDEHDATADFERRNDAGVVNEKGFICPRCHNPVAKEKAGDSELYCQRCEIYLSKEECEERGGPKDEYENDKGSCAECGQEANLNSNGFCKTCAHDVEGNLKNANAMCKCGHDSGKHNGTDDPCGVRGCDCKVFRQDPKQLKNASSEEIYKKFLIIYGSDGTAEIWKESLLVTSLRSGSKAEAHAWVDKWVASGEAEHYAKLKKRYENAGHCGPESWDPLPLETRVEWLQQAGCDINEGPRPWVDLSSDVQVALQSVKDKPFSINTGALRGAAEAKGTEGMELVEPMLNSVPENDCVSCEHPKSSHHGECTVSGCECDGYIKYQNASSESMETHIGWCNQCFEVMLKQESSGKDANVSDLCAEGRKIYRREMENSKFDAGAQEEAWKVYEKHVDACKQCTESNSPNTRVTPCSKGQALFEKYEDLGRYEDTHFPRIIPPKKNSEETCPECGVDLSNHDHRKDCALNDRMLNTKSPNQDWQQYFDWMDRNHPETAGQLKSEFQMDIQDAREIFSSWKERSKYENSEPSCPDCGHPKSQHSSDEGETCNMGTCDCQRRKQTIKNSEPLRTQKFIFQDGDGEKEEIMAKDEAMAWEMLASDFGVSIQELKKMGIKLVKTVKNDSTQTASCDQCGSNFHKRERVSIASTGSVLCTKCVDSLSSIDKQAHVKHTYIFENSMPNANWWDNLPPADRKKVLAATGDKSPSVNMSYSWKELPAPSRQMIQELELPLEELSNAKVGELTVGDYIYSKDFNLAGTVKQVSDAGAAVFVAVTHGPEKGKEIWVRAEHFTKGTKANDTSAEDVAQIERHVEGIEHEVEEIKENTVKKNVAGDSLSGGNCSCGHLGKRHFDTGHGEACHDCDCDVYDEVATCKKCGDRERAGMMVHGLCEGCQNSTVTNSIDPFRAKQASLSRGASKYGTKVNESVKLCPDCKHALQDPKSVSDAYGDIHRDVRPVVKAGQKHLEVSTENGWQTYCGE